MNKLENIYYNPWFSHIYVEKGALELKETQELIDRFAGSGTEIIEILHYKEIFSRTHQNYIAQHKAKSLVLALKQGEKIYTGAKVCQSFGNEHFYYISDVKNCIYNCDYCYLKGMYNSGNLVVFVNIRDTFDEVRKILNEHSAYICISYDSDILALEDRLGFVEKWMDFVQEINKEKESEGSRDRLRIEVRTKSAYSKLWSKRAYDENIIFAFTLSPQYVIESCEHQTPSLELRLDSIRRAIDNGYRVRLCFDPVIICPEWEKHYAAMLKSVYECIPMEGVSDISIGGFRISKDYLKKMRKNQPDCAVCQYPYVNKGGVYQYPDEKYRQMADFIMASLTQHIDRKCIYEIEE